MTERYLAAFPVLDQSDFLRSAAILAAQRNCKIIGIFTRLWKRDGKPQYLAHIPRVWRLLEEDLRHPALAPDRALARSPPAARQPVPPRSAERSVTAAPRSAMVLAAGLGTRLRPVTETIPKPLVEINGRALLDHAIDRLALAGVERVVVNTYYKAAMVAEHLARRDHPQIELSHEDGAARHRRRHRPGPATAR